MGTMLVLDILNRANTMLNDVAKTRWPMQELLDWYNDALRAIVLRRPDANAIDEAFACVLGTRQSLPAGGLRLIDVTRNETAGTAITRMEKNVLDEMNRGWHDATNPVTDVLHYVYDDLNPDVFYLFPAVADTHEVRISYSIAPTKITIGDFGSDNQVIELDDIYCDPLVDYIMARALTKDSEHTQNMARGQAHMQAFENTLGIKTQVDAAVSPNA